MDENSCLIIIGEGCIPTDFPKSDSAEFLKLKSKIDSYLELNDDERKKFEELKIRIKNWKRNFRNDEYYHSILDLTDFISSKYKIKTFYSFLDYCEPDLLKSIEDAINSKYKRIYIISTKLILKNEDILKVQDKLKFVKMKYKDVEIVDLLNLNFDEISEFLINFIKRRGKEI